MYRYGIRALTKCFQNRTVASNALSRVVTPPSNFHANLALNSRMCSPRYAFQVTPFPKLKPKPEWKNHFKPGGIRLKPTFPGLQSWPGLRGMISSSESSPEFLKPKLSGFQSKPEGNFHWGQSKPPLLKPKLSGFPKPGENLHW